MRRHTGTGLEVLLYQLEELTNLQGFSKHRTFIAEVRRKIKFTDLVLQLFSFGAAVDHRYL